MIDFTKRFNVGLPLDSDEKSLDAFLTEYAKYIDEVYFSLPLGSKFHSRRAIQRQFTSKKVVDKFPRLLGLYRKHGVKLELVLNTNMLTREELQSARDYLDSFSLYPDSVCILEEYAPIIRDIFPNCNYILSYNSCVRTISEVDKVQGEYDSWVVGSAGIRNNEMLKHITSRGSDVILLINNGCSFNCTWCVDQANCKPTFDKNKKKHSVEYLYALQSVMPFELYDGTIDVSLVKTFKISNRVSDLKYLKNCLDSYMQNNTTSYIKRSKFNYGLWGRLGWFWKYFPFFSLKRLKKYKEEIVGHEVEIN